MKKRMILYRGSLKSCNYRCSYCPFSKHPVSERELEKDKKRWYSFVEDICENANRLNLGALMVVPYGEAMIHTWYWEGLARLSALPGVDGAGIQTNLSFSAERFLESFKKLGGIPEKLRIWATFHPEMTTVSEFADKCGRLKKAGVKICAGSVGVPENMEMLRELKEALKTQELEYGSGQPGEDGEPGRTDSHRDDIYLWVNKMDGLGRPYTQEEKQGFLEIDPFFERELIPVPACSKLCRERLFVEGDGRLHSCNISPVMKVRWNELTEDGIGKASGDMSESTTADLCGKAEFPDPVCGRRICSCYLAYGGRDFFMNDLLFGPYPLFRIPRCPRAAFLDIMGTLIPEGAERDGRNPGSHSPEEAESNKITPIPREITAGLEALVKEGTVLFFATTLSRKDALKRCHEISHLFSGGIFAGGAHVCLDGEREIFYPLEEAWFSELKSREKDLGFRMLYSRKGEILYKVTLLRPAHNPWRDEEGEEILALLPAGCREAVRYIPEDKCLEILARNADKAEGVRTLCGWMGILPEDTAAAGNSREDAGMLELCN